MKCPEKEDLQHECTAAWNTYEAAVKELGLSASGSGAIWPPIAGYTTAPHPQKALKALGRAIDPETGRLKAPYLSLIALRWEHLKASAALSTHLATHRC